MPTYQYKCRECGHEFEEFQGITDAPIDSCPRCKGKPERVITGGAGFVLKGSGFYSTDYRSQSYKEAEKKENSEVVAPKTPESKKEPAATKSNESKSSE